MKENDLQINNYYDYKIFKSIIALAEDGPAKSMKLYANAKMQESKLKKAINPNRTKLLLAEYLDLHNEGKKLKMFLQAGSPISQYQKENT